MSECKPVITARTRVTSRCRPSYSRVALLEKVTCCKKHTGRPQCELYVRIEVAVYQHPGEGSHEGKKSTTSNTSSLFCNTLPPPNTAPKRSIFTASQTDSRIAQKSVSISPQDQIAAPAENHKDSRNHLPLPPPLASGTKAPQKPRGPSPQQAKMKQAKHFTTENEADEAAQAAMHQRIHLLPNQSDLKDTISKCSTKRKQFENGLMNPTGPALNHPAASLLPYYAKYGCPVNCGPNWTRTQIEEALDYGVHPTAKIPEALECLIK